MGRHVYIPTGATGNEDWIPLGSAFDNIPLYAYINNQSEPLEWLIPSNVSSSCVERSGVGCFFVANKWKFPASWLQEGGNTIMLGLAPKRRAIASANALNN
jgi:rhamnogalacturonan endolyase